MNISFYNTRLSLCTSLQSVCVTVVLCVGLIEALRVDEAQSVKAGLHGSRAVGLIRHQSVITVTHPAVHLETQSSINMDSTNPQPRLHLNFSLCMATLSCTILSSRDDSIYICERGSCRTDSMHM